MTDLLTVTIVIHTTHGLTQAIVTHLVLATGLVIETDIFAEASITDLSVGTLSIAGAYLRLFDTRHHRAGVGDVSQRTGALGPMVDHLALGVGATGRGTWVRALVVDTRVGLGTVGVLPTAHQTHLVEAHVTKETVIVHTTGHWNRNN